MAQIESFSYVVGDKPKALVLGSIPGIASLTAQQYYAHPRNAFWPIMAEYFSFPTDASYQKQINLLLENNTALWDVLRRCEREGSLDSAIKKDTIEPNDIPTLIKENKTIKAILLNGGKASAEFNRHFKKDQMMQRVKVFSLPSTSPAYAAMSFDEKKSRWFAALDSVFNQ